MFTKNIIFKNFKKKKKLSKVKKNLSNLLKENNEVLNSLKPTYNNNYNFKKIFKLKKKLEMRIIGIGGSISGAKAIYDFLPVKKKVHFINNLETRIKIKKKII